MAFKYLFLKLCGVFICSSKQVVVIIIEIFACLWSLTFMLWGLHFISDWVYILWYCLLEPEIVMWAKAIAL